MESRGDGAQTPLRVGLLVSSHFTATILRRLLPPTWHVFTIGEALTGRAFDLILLAAPPMDVAGNSQHQHFAEILRSKLLPGGRVVSLISNSDRMIADLVEAHDREVERRRAVEAELAAHMAVANIGQPQDGLRELIWREACAFYEQENEALRHVAAERDACQRLLVEAAALFRSYEAHHRAKGGSADDKAARNGAIAARIEALILKQGAPPC